MEWWLFPMLLWEVLSTLIYVCYLLGSVSLKLLSNFRLPWPEASGSRITLGYSFCWKHTDVLKPFEMVAHFLQVAAFAPSGYWSLLIIREVLEDTIQSYLSFKQGPMESILQKQDLSLWVTFRFVLCSAFCSSSLISRRHPGAVDIKGLLIVTLVMVTRNTCPLQFEMAFPRHKNKYLVNFVLLNTKWYNSFGAIICVRLLCEYCHVKPFALWRWRAFDPAMLCYGLRDLAGLLPSVLENVVLSDCKEGPGITGWLQNILLSLLFSGWNLRLPGSKKTESGSSCQQSTTSSTTHLKCSNTPMQPMATTGASGACTSSHHRTGSIKGTSQHPSGKSPTRCHFVLTTSPSPQSAKGQFKWSKAVGFVQGW